MIREKLHIDSMEKCRKPVKNRHQIHPHTIKSPHWTVFIRNNDFWIFNYQIKMKYAEENLTKCFSPSHFYLTTESNVVKNWNFSPPFRGNAQNLWVIFDKDEKLLQWLSIFLSFLVLVCGEKSLDFKICSIWKNQIDFWENF